MRTFRLPILFLLGSWGAVGRAQTEVIVPGARVRFVTTPGAAKVAGVVLERHGDTLKVSPKRGESLNVLLPNLATIDLSEGKSRLLGARVGAMWGAAIYGTLGLFASDGGSCNGCRFNRGQLLLYGVYAGGMTGAMFGAIIGKERWTRIVLPAEVRPSLGTTLSGDLRISVSYSWEPGRR